MQCVLLTYSKRLVMYKVIQPSLIDLIHVPLPYVDVRCGLSHLLYVFYYTLVDACEGLNLSKVSFVPTGWGRG